MSDPRKICFILPHFYPEYHGGAEIQCYYLAQEFLHRGWQVHYIRESSDPTTKTIHGIQVHAIPQRKAYAKWLNAVHLSRKMQEIQAEVWYNRATFAYLPWVFRTRRKVGGEVVFAFSRDSQFGYRESWGYYTRWYMNAFLMLEYMLFRFFLRKSDVILTQTRHQQSLLTKRLKLKGTHIYNAHPLPEPVNTTRKSLVIWIARIKHYKHPERFVELARNCQNTDLKFHLVGKLMQDDLSRSLIEQAAELPNLTLTGDLTSEEIHRLLWQARALVCTSEAEGFSNTFIEAWLRGVPVFSQEIDPDQLIQTHGLGVLQEDLAELGEELVKWVQHPERWHSLSQNCQSFARQHFAIEQAVDQFEPLLS